MTASIVPVAPRTHTQPVPLRAGTALPVPGAGAAGGITGAGRRRATRLRRVLLGAIVLLGLLLRVWALDQSPPSLDPDEVSIGYNAWSLARTGRDEYGHTLPLTFRAFGEYKRPAYIYAAVPGLALLGPTPHAVRLPAAVFGALSVPLLYGVAVLLLRSWRAGLCAPPAALAVSPWHLQFTRARGRPACWCCDPAAGVRLCSRPGTPPHGALPRRPVLPLRRPGLPAGPLRLPRAPRLRPALRPRPGPLLLGAPPAGPPPLARGEVVLVGAGLVPLGLQMLDGSARERLNQASIVNVPALRALSRERVTRDVQDGAPRCSTSPWRWACGGR